MKDTAFILIAFVVGILLGYFVDIPFSMEALPTIILCGILFFVGMSVGSDSKTIHAILNLRIELLLLPVMSIVGSLIGTVAATFLLRGMGLFEGLAIGSGLGYYSASSVIIGNVLGASLAAAALFSNVFREVTTLIIAPLIAKYFGPLATISCGGANTSDVVLPVIMRNCGEEYAVPSIYNGVACTFSVPFLVSFFCEQHLALL